MELHTVLFYKHPDSNIQTLLDQLFTQVQGDEAKFISISSSINADSAADSAQDLIDTVDSVEHDLGAESIEHQAGYSIVSFCHGSAGDEFLEMIVQFVKDLTPEISIQAWGQGDDDPWEFWLKFDGDELTRVDDEPLNDPDEDEEIKNKIYAWWHKGLPAEIKVGFLNNLEDE